MATLVLGALGASLGGAMGGSMLGLSMAAVGRFAGATLGRAIDARIMGAGAEPIETGRMDRLRITGAGEGHPIAQVYGRVRLGGHVIWATHFEERVRSSGGGKGTPQPKVKEYSYSVSLAVALCEGEVTGVNRVWADGVEIAPKDLNMRVYSGAEDQLPDPKMEAVEGVGQVPAYRGTAYVVMEDLSLERFGNRVPQFSFEVTRPVQNAPDDVPFCLRGVALMPGSGEYALASERVTYDMGAGESKIANANSPSGESDLVTSLTHLTDELPNCEAVSMIVSWFGDDLRVGNCTVKPLVEQTTHDSETLPWQVCGVTRENAELVPMDEGRPVYGGTPDDASVVQAIQACHAAGQAVMFYPFILMAQMPGNGLDNPWTGEADQPPLPWRGRITLSVAPGRDGSPDGTAAADAEVAAFFGTATPEDFAIEEGAIVYSGDEADWGLSRFILHQAMLCQLAGGVDSFCISSEMRGLTQIRGVSGFPAVTRLIALAAQVRQILGPDVKIGYASDWSEYFGYHPQDGSGDVYFHLDPLWADSNIDFIGIDNYMPLSDWRDEAGHADEAWGSIYNLDYLKANVAGGEGYDWYYDTPEARDAQRRTEVTDGAHNEPWVWRYKDIANWWGNSHHDRIGGQRATTPTAWIPQSKPVWFTELGCGAVDKGTNQPNKFLDPKSSESILPRYSNGLRDEMIQRQYLRAFHDFWNDPENNPVSELTGDPMIDMGRAFVWAWDARPYPWFPNADGVWSDGPNYTRGHWITGRCSSQTLASVVEEICEKSGVGPVDTSELYGIVRGYAAPGVSEGRRSLQPLMLAYGIDAIEKNGTLVFQMRTGREAVEISEFDLSIHPDLEGDLMETRTGEADLSGRVRLSFVEADGDHRIIAEESVLPDDETHAVAASDLPLTLTRGEGRQTVERWLNEARLSRDSVRFALPMSRMDIGAGDVVLVPGGAGPFRARVDRVDLGAHLLVDAVRIDPEVYEPSAYPEDSVVLAPGPTVVPVLPMFMDLPLMTGAEAPHAPHLAVTARPWPGAIALYSAPQDTDYQLDMTLNAQARIGITANVLAAAPSGRIDHGPALEVRMTSGELRSVSDEELLSGANLFAIGDGTPDHWEIFQARDAELIGERTWRLSHRLRGQFGSDGLQPEAWGEGAYLVALDGTLSQLPLAPQERGVERHYRVGPASETLDSSVYTHRALAFAGNGLRPYAPVHVQSLAEAGGTRVTWIRRSRLEGDSWAGMDIPLGEEQELYLVEIWSSGALLRQEQASSPSFLYSATMQSADGAAGSVEVRVSQVSASFGPGPATRATVDLS